MSAVDRADEVNRHVSHRCPRMGEHMAVHGLPVPCDKCYSIESYWRRIPWEPDSETPVDDSVLVTDEIQAVLDAAEAFINCEPIERPPRWAPLAAAVDAYLASRPS
jgi:hypothetical protein